MLLKKNVLPDKSFLAGLDLGCGVGHSTLALKNKCINVVGLDPNKNMLSHALEADGVSYHLWDAGNIEWDDDSFDIITFAGSFYYGKSKFMVDEVERVAKNKAYVLLYDFDVDVFPVLNILEGLMD